MVKCLREDFFKSIRPFYPTDEAAASAFYKLQRHHINSVDDACMFLKNHPYGDERLNRRSKLYYILRKLTNYEIPECFKCEFVITTKDIHDEVSAFKVTAETKEHAALIGKELHPEKRIIAVTHLSSNRWNE